MRIHFSWSVFNILAQRTKDFTLWYNVENQIARENTNVKKKKIKQITIF